MEFNALAVHHQQFSVPPFLNHATDALSATRRSCLDSEGWGPYSVKRSADFTPCFETVALAVPNAVLIIAGIALIGGLCSRKKKTRGVWSTTMLCWKLCFLVGALVFSVAHLSLAIYVSSSPSRDQYVHCSAVFAASNLISIFITYVNHTRTRRSSDILLSCWTVILILTIPRIRTAFALLDYKNSFQLAIFISFTSFTILTAFAFFFESLGPEWNGHRGHIRLEEQPTDNPLATANLFSRLTFSYQSHLIGLSATRYLQEEDIPLLRPDDRASILCNTLESNWAKATTETRYRTSKRSYSLFGALARAYGYHYSMAIVCKTLSNILVFLQPQLLRALLQFVYSYLKKKPQPPIHGVMIAIGMLVTRILQTILNQQCIDRALKTGNRVKVGILALLYKKSLVLSNSERANRSPRDMLNLQSVDASRLGNLCLQGTVLTSAPIEIIAAVLSLWFLLGWPSLCGVLLMVFSLPLGMMLATYQHQLEAEQMKFRNKRTRLMNEILSNMRSIKISAWEPTFSQKVLQLRNDHELRLTRKLGIAKALNSWFTATVPLIVSFTTFAAYAYAGKHALTADILFPAIALYGLLQLPLATLPHAVMTLIGSTASEARLVDFLEAEELQPDARVTIHTRRGDPKPCLGDEVVSITDGVFHWGEMAEPALQDINLSIKMGDLVAVLGRPGDGKSTLVAAILGELTKVQGQVTVRGSVAYFSQEPFILSTTFKNNITFGHTFDEDFYNRVLDVCLLRPDIQSMSCGEDTEISANGVSLSASLTARITLARAIYARADIYVLDDPLSAVDEDVAAKLFNAIIGPQGLLRDKARIWCTNSFTFLSSSNRMILLRSGEIAQQATYDEVMSSRGGSLYAHLIEGHGHDASGHPCSVNDSQNGSAQSLMPAERSEASLPEETNRLAPLPSFKNAQLLSLDDDGELTIQRLKDRMKPRDTNAGWPDQAKTYISAVTPLAAAGFLMAAVGTEALSVVGNLILRSWTDENARHGHASSSHRYHLLCYGLACSLSSVFAFATCVAGWVNCSIRASRRFHDAALSAVMGSSMDFFERTPQAQIMDGFSHDLYLIDDVLALLFAGFFTSLVSLLGALYIIGMGAPILLFAAIPVFSMYHSMMDCYMDAYRDIKDFNDQSRTHIFDWFGETIAGLSVIRAYNQQSRFVANNEAIIDRNQTFYLPSVTVTRWISIRTELIGALIMFTAALSPVWALANSRFVDAGLVGLTVSYAVSVTKNLGGVMRCAGEVENNMVSLKRIVGYADLTQEASFEVEDRKPPSTWPEEGRVVFRHYSACYAGELGLRLSDVCLDIRPGEKVGVCGTEGSGLALALFRIIESSAGSIVIDDVDISEIGLHDLRSALVMIPADPHLFDGSIRDNVDPASKYSDADIWSAVSQTHLKPLIETMARGLSSSIFEGGRNLTQGQRQLVCFARAILRKSKVLVLEKNSSIDLETEATIRKILSEDHFRGMTVITITQHRLYTIRNSDRVIVMDEGRVAEFDSPDILLSQPDSMFSSLCASNDN